MFEKWNMKKIVLYLLVVMGASFGIGLSILASTGWGGVNFGGSRYAVNQEKAQTINTNKNTGAGQNSEVNQQTSTVQNTEVNQQNTSEAKTVNDISIEADSSDINIISEDRQDVKAVLTGKASNKEVEPKLEMNLSNDKLFISVKTKSIISINVNSNVQLNVYVPKDYKNNLKVKASSAKVNIKDFNLKEYSCEVTSGNMTIENMNSEVVSVKSSSGRLRGNNINSKRTSVNITSGAISIDKFKGDLQGGCTSGSIDISYAEFNNNIDLTAVSGNININLPKESEFYLDARAASGNVSCNFPITVSGEQKQNHIFGTVKSDKNKINIKVSSGNVYIQ